MADIPPPPGFTLVDEVGDPPPPPGFTVIPDDVPPPPAGFEVIDEPAPKGATPGERVLDRGPIGRVLDSFGQGLKDGWGTAPIGMSDQTADELRKMGIFPAVDAAMRDPFKIFNEALIRPAAADFDRILRGTAALAVGTAAGIGEAAEVVGLAEGDMSKRLTRDLLVLADTLGVTTGTAPFGIKPRIDPMTKRAADGVNKSVTAAAKVEDTTPWAALPATEEIVDKAGNINLKYIQAPEDVKNVIRETALANDGFQEARRGVRTWVQTEKAADALGMTIDDFNKRKIGEAFNAEEIDAATKLLVQTATDVRNWSAKIAAGDNADDAVMNLQEAIARHATVQEQFSGVGAEAGRALNIMRKMRGATKDAQGISDLIEQMGGRATAQDIARKINQLDTPEQISQFLMDSRKVKMSDMALEVWMNSLLSGPTTHMVNILSNSLNAMWAVPETAVAATVGAVRRGMGGTGEAVMFGEAGARAFGIVQGAKDGLIAGWRTYQTEIPSAGPNKLEVPRPRAIPSKQVQIGDTTIEIGGKQVRIPGRLLMAEDEFFKGIAYRQELNALAYRQASKEGLDGQAFAARVTELTNKPTDDFVRKASQNADYQTFTKELGPTGKSLMQFVNTHPALRIPFTFIRTPTNILKYAGERTPLALFSKIVRDELSGVKGSIARDTQIAKIVTGSTVMAAAAGLAAEGLITGGGPKDSSERAVMYLNGWQPYSVKVGDMYYSYGRIEPLGLIMGVAADAYDLGDKMTDPEAEDIGMLGAIAVAKNLTSKTWLRGPAELMQAATDPERYGETWLRKLAGTAVPTVLAQSARLNDPYLREANSIFEAIKGRTPGLSASLLPRRDIWGEPIALEGALGPDALSPIYESKMKNDPVNQELLALKIWPSKLEKQIRGVELTPDQYDDFQRVAGRFAKYSVDAIVKQPGWGDLPEFARKDVINRTITSARETGRQWMLMTYPNILKDATDAKIKQISGAK